ncbi:hypothetical protein EV356DRAFT_455523 [Viridothelium virens]|uniref:Zn(2)-C6 fungal-type domain-containing protein n=1 Tax=Viridothelium virens TaxID=1048519 RepID=A0A6A6GVH6_VIRVR|nr:hypothetical protein EV356DRAFT_455523 [Viridothelium virens]
MDHSPTDASFESPPFERNISRSKQAACIACRRSKIKCRRNEGELRCEKCQQNGAECIVPDYHVGRRKGVKNKRRGLEKAVYQVEQALANAKAPQESAELQRLVDQSRRLQSETGTEWSDEIPHETAIPGTSTNELDDAENPLQLLARASDLHVPSTKPTEQTNKSDDPRQVKWYFAPVRAKLDTGDDIDPVDLGLASPEEADMLFRYFFHNLSHTRWGLDPIVHTVPFVRSQSAFLFTSIMAASALFVPSAAALCKRLAKHCKFLANRAMTQRFRSVEIILAFLINIPWMFPGEQSADDETCLYLGTAITISIDICLDKVIVPSGNFDGNLNSRLPRSDCIDDKRALYMDGFSGVDPSSEWSKRLLRRRERTWLALWNLERGVCLARGRRYACPVTPLIQNCDSWHISNIADCHDGSVTSMVVLRRDLQKLVDSVRSRCDNFRIIDVESEVAESMKRTIEDFFDQWMSMWSISLGGGHQNNLPPYVKILVTHTILSTYCMVINHPTAPTKVKNVFHSEALSAALKVMRTAVRGESELESMPNNTAIMISFAACFALKLSSGPLHPSIKDLIMETADMLQRIGATSSHRQGASVLYGKYLQEVLKHSTFKIAPANTNQDPNLTNVFSTNVSESHMQLAPGSSEPLQFSAMSDEQILNAINETGIDMNLQMADASIDDLAGLDWLGWIDPSQISI